MNSDITRLKTRTKDLENMHVNAKKWLACVNGTKKVRDVVIIVSSKSSWVGTYHSGLSKLDLCSLFHHLNFIDTIPVFGIGKILFSSMKFLWSRLDR